MLLTKLLQKDYTKNSDGYQLKLPLNLETIIPDSEENYLFLEANGQLSYIKPANYEISKTRKYKNDIGKIENMEYDVKKDIYTCRNGKKLGVDHIRHSKSKTGYVSEKTIYKCEDCNGCPYKSECIKGNN
jgi:hypothetical protein